jgi:hypothetical protein
VARHRRSRAHRRACRGDLLAGAADHADVLALPWLLRRGWEFWPSLLSVAVLTMGLYAGTMWLLPRLGIRI